MGVVRGKGYAKDVCDEGPRRSLVATEWKAVFFLHPSLSIHSFFCFDFEILPATGDISTHAVCSHVVMKKG